MCRLLVVSNVRHERRLIAEQALSLCDTVEEVPDSDSAAKALKHTERRPDIIVTVLDADGIELVDMLRRQSNGGSSIPIVLIIEPGQAAVASAAGGSGIRSLIWRPLNGAALSRALHEILEGLKDDVRLEADS